MKMITEDYVSFETAKLLKERGYCNVSIVFYKENGELVRHYKVPLNNNGVSDTLGVFYEAPTLQMAMKWLRETHNIDISVVPHSHEKGKAVEYEFVYWNGEEYHVPYDEKHPTYHELFGKTWKKYEEACEAAIKYCLVSFI